MNAHIAALSVGIAIDPVLVQESSQLSFINLMIDDDPAGPVIAAAAT